jgi:hypothetical protein
MRMIIIEIVSCLGMNATVLTQSKNKNVYNKYNQNYFFKLIQNLIKIVQFVLIYLVESSISVKFYFSLFSRCCQRKRNHLSL